jgi:sugar phosphate isomerase/epimerase
MVIFAAVAAMLPFVQASAPSFEIFAMDNGVGRGIWSPERQASTLRNIGFDGISYNYTTPADLKAWIAELAKRNLKLYGICFAVRLEGDNPFPTGIAEAVQLLRGTGAVLWVNIPSPEHVGDFESIAVKRVQATADLAATARLRVVLYPHRNQYVETAEHAFALATRCGRANVGVTVNLCHELGAGNGARLPEIIRLVAPCLAMVSINGATAKIGQGWDNQNYIKLLGDGDYDVAGVLRALTEVRYCGPVGIQYYYLKGDQRGNLEASMRAWHTLTKATTAP